MTRSPGSTSHSRCQVPGRASDGKRRRSAAAPSPVAEGGASAAISLHAGQPLGEALAYLRPILVVPSVVEEHRFAEIARLQAILLRGINLVDGLYVGWTVVDVLRLLGVILG